MSCRRVMLERSNIGDQIIIKRDDPEAVKKHMEKYGIDINMTIGGQTMLHAACRFGRVSTVEMLLGQPGVDVNARDSDRSTPLHSAVHSAVFESKAKIVQILLKDDRVDVNAKDRSRWTPLHWAVRFLNPGIVKMLLTDDRTSMHVRNADGFFAWEVGTGVANRGAILKLFKKYQLKKFRAGTQKKLWESIYEWPPGVVEINMAPFLLPKIPGPDPEDSDGEEEKQQY